jgi:starch synthase
VSKGSRAQKPCLRSGDGDKNGDTADQLDLPELPRVEPRPLPLALVHHANQYLITDGYDNRHGLRATVGTVESRSGLSWILELHRIHNVPANLHLSGTLLEAIAWHQPAFLTYLRELYESGLVEFVGSCYGQNIMRFFSYEHNVRQLNEELWLYQTHLGVEPSQVKVFWPPERVWDTARMAAVLEDPRLLNHGYQYVFLDDRLLLPVDGYLSPRRRYDRELRWDPQLFQMCRVEQSQGLVALPIAHNLRQCIPPTQQNHWEQLRKQLCWLSSLDPGSFPGDLLAVYGDDMEKAAGLGAWSKEGPAGFEALLDWIRETPWIKPVKLSQWCPASRVADSRAIEVGTFVELANHFAAGEGYEKWYFDPQWDRYRKYYDWAQSRVNELSLSGADPALIDLAEKHLMVSSWESAWHTPQEGPFGNPEAFGHPSPWIKAVGSHSRHAAVIAEAAYWMRHKDDAAHAYLSDIDSDGEDELIVKNDRLFAVLSPRWGGRLVALFSIEGAAGKMVIGNPSDDWNWMEELNRCMEVPPNHPGALTDQGFEHDIFAAHVCCERGETVRVELSNQQPHSDAMGLKKEITLTQGQSALQIDYTLPEKLRALTVEFALSPDYLSLLRYGSKVMKACSQDGSRGWSALGTTVRVKPERCKSYTWSTPYREDFGHKASLRLAAAGPQFRVWIELERT